MKKKFAGNNFVQLLIETNLLYIEFKPHCIINLTLSEEILQLITSLCKEEKYLVLQDMNNLKWIDKQARDLWASHPVNKNMIAWAYHSRDPIHKVMYTIYKTLSEPEIVTGFFQNPEEGRRWLKEREDENEKI
jgi:hypothetical protein